MSCKAIETYLNGTLSRQLHGFGVDSAFIDRIIDTVREQMTSCLYHWSDARFRRALLVIGSEESHAYRPHANDDIRSFVVVTIRNSDFETIASKHCAVAGLAEEISPTAIRMVTSTAIEYFSKQSFTAMIRELTPPDFDKYGGLAEKYPTAWRALWELANMKSQFIRYEPVASAPIDISIIPPRGEVTIMGSAQLHYVVADGYSFSLERETIGELRRCAAHRAPFVVDSFKSLTRNIEKLLIILEYLLQNGAIFATSNYLLTNGYLERRAKLLKAGSTEAEMQRNWRQTAGLGPNHKYILELATGR